MNEKGSKVQMVKINDERQLRKFVEALMEGNPEEALKSIGVDPESLDHSVFRKCTPEERERSHIRALEMNLRNTQRAPELIDRLLHEMQTDCCDKPEHKYRPDGPKDWVPVERFMRGFFTAHRQSSHEFVSALQMILDRVLEETGHCLSDTVIDILDDISGRSAIEDAILAAHFKLMEKGKNDFADMHYEMIVGLVRSHVPKRIKELKERIEHHEQEIARGADRSAVSARTKDRRAGGRAQGTQKGKGKA